MIEVIVFHLNDMLNNQAYVLYFGSIVQFFWRKKEYRVKIV